MKIYLTRIRPVVSYASETWTVNGQDKRGSVYLKGRYEERYLAHYEPGKIPGEYKVMLNSIVQLMERTL
jgi:hypothetical protein